MAENTKGLYWGPTKLDLICVNIQTYGNTHQKLANKGFMVSFLAHLIPDIKNHLPSDLRISSAESDVEARMNVGKLKHEPSLSECSSIYGEISFEYDGMPMNLSINFFVKSEKKNFIFIMHEFKDWPENLKIKYEDNIQNEVDKIVNELISIGNSVNSSSQYPGFMNDARTKEIGGRLNDIGGWSMMVDVHKTVAQHINSVAAAELSISWHGVGDWLH